jgi:hypothetical protein
MDENIKSHNWASIIESWYMYMSIIPPRSIQSPSVVQLPLTVVYKINNNNKVNRRTFRNHFKNLVHVLMKNNILTIRLCSPVMEHNKVAVSPTLNDTLFGLGSKNGILDDEPFAANAETTTESCEIN